MNYYENKHGNDIIDFLESEAKEMLLMFATVNALKYSVRAGKKQGESYNKDISKMEDYINIIKRNTNLKMSEIIDNLTELKEEFNKFE